MRDDKIEVRFTLPSIAMLWTMIFVILKLCHVVEWAWIWVFMPLIAGVGLFLIILFILFLVYITHKDEF